PIERLTASFARGYPKFLVTSPSRDKRGSAGVRTLPREERDLFIAMCWHLTTPRPSRRGSRMHSAGWRAEAVLQSATSTPDESLLDAARPIILNGIEELSAVRISPTAPCF